MDEAVNQDPVEEQRILSDIDVKASISPKVSAGAIALRIVAGQFLGVFPKYFANRAISNWNAKGMFRTLESNMEIEEGDVKDMVDKTIKVKEMILTEKNIFFLYDKGFISKTKKMIALPVEPIVSVETGKKCVVASYEMPQEGKPKPIRFDLVLYPKEPEAWAEAIRKVVSGPAQVETQRLP